MDQTMPHLLSRYPDSSYLRGRAGATMRLGGVDERIDDLYLAIAGFEDPDFAAKLDQDPKAMLWEMMVAKLLRASGLELLPRKPKGPDFPANCGGQKIAVEAVCPGLGDPVKPDSVPELRPLPDTRPVPTNKVLLRISAALAEKKKAFDRYLADGIVTSGTACVIAISSQKIDQAWGMQPCAGLTATLGHGPVFAVFDSKTSECVRQGYQRKEWVTKSNGSAVSTVPFLDDSYSAISGILYSDTSATGFPYDLIGDSYFICARSREERTNVVVSKPYRGWRRGPGMKKPAFGRTPAIGREV